MPVEKDRNKDKTVKKTVFLWPFDVWLSPSQVAAQPSGLFPGACDKPPPPRPAQARPDPRRPAQPRCQATGSWSTDGRKKPSSRTRGLGRSPGDWAQGEESWVVVETWQAAGHGASCPGPGSGSLPGKTVSFPGHWGTLWVILLVLHFSSSQEVFPFCKAVAPVLCLLGALGEQDRTGQLIAPGWALLQEGLGANCAWGRTPSWHSCLALHGPVLGQESLLALLPALIWPCPCFCWGVCTAQAN